MNNSLIENYFNSGIEVDFSLLKKVDFDSIITNLHKATSGKYSYETDIIDDQGGTVRMKLRLYIPGKVVDAYTTTTYEKINNGIRAALIEACSIISGGIDTTTPTINKVDNGEALTALNQLNEIEKEINQAPVQEKPKKDYGIRQDQIEFMKKFQNALKIDTEEKFDTYVKAWSDAKTVGITTKKNLVAAGPEALDLFIEWIKEVHRDNMESNTFVCPSDSEFDSCC